MSSSPVPAATPREGEKKRPPQARAPGGVQAPEREQSEDSLRLATAGRPLRRKCASCGGSLPEDELNGRGPALRRCAACEAALADGRPAPGGCSCDAGRAADRVADTLSGGGRALDPATRAYFEGRFGRGMGAVRVHDGPSADASARAMNALAYTVGDHVAFRAGHYAPDTREGKRLLAHELTHTLQPREGSGTGSVVRGFRVDRPGDPAEREADRVADAVVSGGPVPVPGAAAPPLARQHEGAPAVDAGAVGTAVDTILDRLEGYTSGADSTAILAQFTGRSAATMAAITAELERRGAGNVSWMFTDMTEEDGRALRTLLIQNRAVANILELVAEDLVGRLSGWTSENDSREIVSAITPFTGGELDRLLAAMERKAEMDMAGMRGWLFGDMDRANGWRLGEHLYNSGGTRALDYATGWTVDKTYDLIAGFTSLSDSAAVVRNIEVVPVPLRRGVLSVLDEKCVAERSQSAEDSLMEDLAQADYNRLRAMEGVALRPYDRLPSTLEQVGEWLAWGVDWAFTLAQWGLCGVAGIVTGVLAVIWDLVVLVADILVAVWDLLGSLVYLFSGGAAGSAEWLAVKQFFVGIGHLFTNPGAVFDRMWEDTVLEFRTIEGPLTPCRQAEFIVRKFVYVIVNIVLLFVAGYGAVKAGLSGLQAAREFAALARSVGLGRAIAQVSGEAATAVRRFVAVSAARAGEIATQLRTPRIVLSRVRAQLTAVTVAAEREQYWRYVYRRGREYVVDTVESEREWWANHRERWRATSERQGARHRELDDGVRELEENAAQGRAPEDADAAVQSATDDAERLGDDAAALEAEVAGEPRPTEPAPPAETAPPREPERPPPDVVPEEPVRAVEPTPDGQHEVRVRGRSLERCSFDCKLFRETHEELLADRPDLDRTLTRIEPLAAGDATQAAEATRRGALLDQRARDIYRFRTLDEAGLQAEVASARDIVAANEARFEAARRANPGLTYDGWAREGLAAAAGERAASDVEALFGNQGLTGLVDELGNEALARLLQGSTAVELQGFLATHGTESVRWAAALSGTDARALLTDLTGPALAGLRDVDAAAARRLLTDLGRNVLNTVSPTLNGTRLGTIVEMLGPRTARALCEQHMGGNLPRLVEFADNLHAARALILGSGPLGPNSVVIDSNTYIALEKLIIRRQPWVRTGPLKTDVGLFPAEQASINRLRALRGHPPLGPGDPIPADIGTLVPGLDLRAPNTVIAEGGADARILGGGVEVTVPRTDPAYEAILADLRGTKPGQEIGGPAGNADRALVADALVTSTTGGALPTFVSADGNIYGRLANRFGVTTGPHALRVRAQLPGEKYFRMIAAENRAGFEVNVRGRRMLVIPVAD